MKTSTKAALLSALVCPGAGHFYLKKRLVGGLLASTALVAIYFLVSQALERAFEISEQIQRGEVQLDAQTISELLSAQSSGTDMQLLNMATSAFIICWLIGIIDAYRIAHGQEKKSIS